MADEDHAVIVGITHYPSLGDLKGTENDARIFRDWLVAPDGGGVPQSNVQLIVSSEVYDAHDAPSLAKPTAEQVESALSSLIEAGIDVGGKAGRRLYLFLAGHGFGPDVEEAALLMANAGRYRMGYHIPGRRYARWFRTSALFDEVVLFMDCCRDEHPNLPFRPPPWVDISRPAGADVRHFFGFATKWSRQARERPIYSGGPVHGLFTLALLSALRFSPGDNQGRVTGADIERYIFNYLPRLITQKEYQEPRFDYDKMRDIVFCVRTEPVRMLVKFTFDKVIDQLPIEILNHRFEIVARLQAYMDSWEMKLEPGTYLLRVPGTQMEKVFEVLGEETVHVSFK